MSNVIYVLYEMASSISAINFRSFVLFGGIYYKVWAFQEITPYIVAALVGGMPTAIAYGFKRGDNAPERAMLTTPAPIQEQIPSLAYGRIIIRPRTENQHDGTYRDSLFIRNHKFYAKHFSKGLPVFIYFTKAIGGLIRNYIFM